MQISATFLRSRIDERLRILSKNREWLAEEMNIAVRTLDYYRSGETAPDAIALGRMAEALDVQVSYFYGDSAYPPTTQSAQAMHDAPVNTNAVRSAMETLREQAGALLKQINFYEKHLCGASSGEGDTKYIAKEMVDIEGAKELEKPKGEAEERRQPDEPRDGAAADGTSERRGSEGGDRE